MLAERSGLVVREQVAVRRGDDPHIDVVEVVAAEALNLALLDGS
ncbi:MAG: hypothetical protein P8R42_16450 [Candidatus Binatia bacterium]|nr:hypothetical protein [Candidatus Binatia bacterium]